MERFCFTLNLARTIFEACLCVNGCDGANAQATPNVMIVAECHVVTSHGLFQLLG